MQDVGKGTLWVSVQHSYLQVRLYEHLFTVENQMTIQMEQTYI